MRLSLPLEFFYLWTVITLHTLEAQEARTADAHNSKCQRPQDTEARLWQLTCHSTARNSPTLQGIIAYEVSQPGMNFRFFHTRGQILTMGIWLPTEVG